VKSTLMQKGDFHECFNNTSLDMENNGIIILADNVSDSLGTIVRNNAAERMGSARSDSTPLASGTIHDHNWNGYENGNADMRTLLRDPDNLDFRPRADATELIDAGVTVTCTVNGKKIDVTDGYKGKAPDIGAYEFGDSEYWIAGRKLPEASMPVPPHGSKTVKHDADLMWLAGLNAARHKIYFGKTAELGKADFKGEQTNNIFKPGTLTKGTTYHWRIDSVTAKGVTRGTVWEFTVK
jgi:hypothetical protein